MQTAIFSHDEAVSLIHCAVYPNTSADPSIAEIGVVVGLLDMNDEVELIVKFQSSVSQYTKSELISQFVIES
ncbi:hypothetical protein IDSA_05770 [Pseudidiomarina salinarum]|uniref:DUF4926 domain-containing protein n=2 Tax=Pseudidiomarina salinarum TaxID=435908 RepID=A0A094JBT6_9GAMM|nr:hypothetical protein IDSA_05770 [Pseudidiomarina salinarum]